MNRSLQLLVPVAAVLVLACAPSGTPSPSAAQPAEIDRAFIDMMVPHHQSAIEMAGVALERSQRPEVRNLAEQIISAQEAEVAQLREWRTEWFGSDATPPMSEMPLLPGMQMPGMPAHSATGTMDMTVDIEMLRTAEPFDQAFARAMIEHHSMAIEAAEIVSGQSQMPEIRSLAGQIIDSQQSEIDLLESWLAEWGG